MARGCGWRDDRAAWPLSVGGRLMIDGETITVTVVDGADVSGFTGRGEPVRFVLTRVEGRRRLRCERGVAVRVGAAGRRRAQRWAAA